MAVVHEAHSMATVYIGHYRNSIIIKEEPECVYVIILKRHQANIYTLWRLPEGHNRFLRTHEVIVALWKCSTCLEIQSNSAVKGRGVLLRKIKNYKRVCRYPVNTLYFIMCCTKTYLAGLASAVYTLSSDYK